MPDINLRVQVDGVDDLLKGFQRTFTNIGPAMQRMQERLVKRLSTYPPPPPSSTYERTGALGRAWQMSGAVGVDARGTNLFQDRVSAELRNETDYAAWVQGDPRDGGPSQAKIHKGRWETTQQAIEAEEGLFLEDMADAIEGAFH